MLSGLSEKNVKLDEQTDAKMRKKIALLFSSPLRAFTLPYCLLS